MTDRTLTRLLAKARSGHPGRSEAYAWLRIKFERLYPLLEWRKLTFQQVAEDLAESGKRGGRGKPLTAHAAFEIWKRVKQDVAAEEPWRMDALRIAMQHGGASQKPRVRESRRGANADQPPPVVTTPAPRPPIPSYPAPLQSRRPKIAATHSRPNAPSSAVGAVQTPEEMIADLQETINRRSGRY